MIYQNQDLKKTFKKILQQKIETKKLKLSVVLIGKDFASIKYVQAKSKIANKLGLDFEIFNFLAEIELKQLLSEFENIQKNSDGIIVQLPIPQRLNPVLTKISAQKDVDMLGRNFLQLFEKGFLPPTVGAVDLVLKDILIKDQYKNSTKQKILDLNPSFKNVTVLNYDLIKSILNLSGVKVCLIGQGKLVGKPLLDFFLRAGATVLTVNKSTPNPKQICKLAQIVVSGAGQPNLVDTDWLQSGALVVDAATSESNGALTGDVNKANLPENIILSPSPKGIGPVTVLYLFWNLWYFNVYSNHI